MVDNIFKFAGVIGICIVIFLVIVKLVGEDDSSGRF